MTDEIKLKGKRKKEARRAFKDLRNAVSRLGRSGTRAKAHKEYAKIRDSFSRLKKIV